VSRWRTALEGSVDYNDVFPTLLHPADPWAGDEYDMTVATHAGYLHCCPHDPPLSADAHTALDARFRDTYRAVLSGAEPWDALAPIVSALGLDFPLKLDRRPGPTDPGRVTDAVLAEMCEDYVPDIGVVALDRVLGPFAEEPQPRWLRVLAGAVMSFAPLLREGVMPLSRAVAKKPRPPAALSASIRAAVRTPPMLWHVEGDRLRPALPFSDRLVPKGAVANLPDAPAVVARAVRAPDGGAWLACALPLPVCPDLAIVQRRMWPEVWRLRRHDIRVTWEDVLRDRGEALYRTCSEWLWWHEPDATRELWRR